MCKGVLHKSVRAQVRVRDAGTLDLFFGLQVQAAQRSFFQPAADSDHRELDEMTNARLASCANEIALQFSLARVGRREDEDFFDAFESGFESLRFIEVAES
jgi:hypothetical protein